MTQFYEDYLNFFFNPILKLFELNENRLLLFGYDITTLPKTPEILNFIKFIDVHISYSIKGEDETENLLITNKSKVSSKRIASTICHKYPTFIASSDSVIMVRAVNNNIKDICERLVDFSTVHFNEMI